MAGRVIPNLEIIRVTALPMPASSYSGQLCSTAAGLFWSDGVAWQTLSGDGAPPESIDPWHYIVLPSNFSTSSTSFSDVTGMSFVAQANTRYEVEVFGAFQSAATTTGAALALDIPGGIGSDNAVVAQGIHNLAASTLTGWEQIADNTTTGAGSGVRAANTNVPIRFRAVVKTDTSVGGTIQLRMRSEVASSAVTLQAGITVMKWRVADRQSTFQPIIPITQADYDALSPPAANALYVVVPSVAGNPNYRWVALTDAEYTALTPKDAETLYVVTD